MAGPWQVSTECPPRWWRDYIPAAGRRAGRREQPPYAPSPVCRTLLDLQGKRAGYHSGRGSSGRPCAATAWVSPVAGAEGSAAVLCLADCIASRRVSWRTTRSTTPADCLARSSLRASSASNFLSLRSMTAWIAASRSASSLSNSSSRLAASRRLSSKRISNSRLRLARPDAHDQRRDRNQRGHYHRHATERFRRNYDDTSAPYRAIADRFLPGGSVFRSRVGGEPAGVRSAEIPATGRPS